MRKKLLGYILFFVILIGGFLLYVFAGTDMWKSKSPVISYVKPFSFVTQDNKLFSNNDMAGKVCVVEYFFTTCKSICPMMNTNMYKIYEEFRDYPDFMILSHTCDPERDSASVLKHYSDSLKVDNKKWIFLTGRKDSLYYAARNSYLLDDPNNGLQDIDDQFIHTQFFALVDKKGQVRGQVYDGLKEEELNKMKENIKALLKE